MMSIVKCQIMRDVLPSFTNFRVSQMNRFIFFLIILAGPSNIYSQERIIGFEVGSGGDKDGFQESYGKDGKLRTADSSRRQTHRIT